MRNPFRFLWPKQQQQDIPEKRTWNTPVREPWNPIIKHCLNAIDYHIDLYLKTNDIWHLDQADRLRKYLHDLKNWILREEYLHHDMENLR